MRGLVLSNEDRVFRTEIQDRTCRWFDGLAPFMALALRAPLR